MRYRGILSILVVCILAGACSGQSLESEKTVAQPSQTADAQLPIQKEPAATGKNPANYVPGEVLVKFKDSVDEQFIKAVQIKLHLKVIKRVGRQNLYLMKITDNVPVDKVVKQLQEYQQVNYAEPNYVRSTY